MRRYKALRSVGVDVISAAFIAFLNHLWYGPAIGPICLIGFLNTILEIDDQGT